MTAPKINLTNDEAVRMAKKFNAGWRMVALALVYPFRLAMAILLTLSVGAAVIVSTAASILAFVLLVTLFGVWIVCVVVVLVPFLSIYAVDPTSRAVLREIARGIYNAK